MIKFVRRCLPSSPLALLDWRRLPPSKSSARQECPIEIDNGPLHFVWNFGFHFQCHFPAAAAAALITVGQFCRGISFRNRIRFCTRESGPWTTPWTGFMISADCWKTASRRRQDIQYHNPVLNEDHPKLVGRDSAPRGGPFPASLSVLAFIQ